MIQSTLNKGFQMSFENGLTISVQFGAGNYCSNKDLNKPPRTEMQQDFTTTNTAEIAIWDNEGKDYQFKNSGGSKGWLTADEVAQWILKVQKAKSLKNIKQ